MTIDVIHQATEPIVNTPSTSQPHDFGQQFLTFLKMVIYGLVILKLFQLTFLRYRRKLALSDRIEKKYRYCHHEFIDSYSDDQNKLMHTTINNTIKNTQVKPASKNSKGQKIAKRVSFNTDKNSYHQIKVALDDEDEMGEKGVQKTIMRESNRKEELLQKKNKILQDISQQQKSKGTLGPETSDLGIMVDTSGQEVQESKITQQTQASSLLEGNSTKQEMNVSQSQLHPLKHHSHL